MSIYRTPPTPICRCLLEAHDTNPTLRTPSDSWGEGGKQTTKCDLAPTSGASALLTGSGGGPPFKNWGHSLSVDPTNKQSQAHPTLPSGKQPIAG